MKFETISSRDNSLLRLARAVRDDKNRDFVFVEGLRLCEEAVRSGLAIEALIVSDELAGKAKPKGTIKALAAVARRSAVISEKLLESISYTKTPQGVVVLATRPAADKELQLPRKQAALIVVLHWINNPVNVGAILRTAEAAGVHGAVLTERSADPFSPKALRGAMGAAFRLPIWFGPTYEQTIDWCAKNQLQSVCADVHAKLAYDQLDWSKPSALVMGPESTGLSDVEIAAADLAVGIPMQGKAESLNVAVAAGILLYEAARQRW
jgi:TrmH family RNA methyltransferase